MNSSKWLHQLATLETDAVLITVLDTKGSVPREAGTKMLVTPTDIQGTIGGGNLEHQCIALATERLSNHEELGWLRDIRRFPLGARLGQCCGGLVIVMLEYITTHDTLAHDSWVKQLNTALTEKRAAVLVTPLAQSKNKFLINSEQLNRPLFHKSISDECQHLISKLFDSSAHENSLLLESKSTPEAASYFFEKYVPSSLHIMLFGAGHVGQALVKTLEDIDCQISWVDSREQQFPDTLPANTQRIVSDDPTHEVSTAPADTYFLIMTHNHQLDQDLCEAALKRDDFRFCGLIGSMTKKHKFEHRLRAKGLSDATLKRLTCPIGISGISGKAPAVIAVAVAAQLLALA